MSLSSDALLSLPSLTVFKQEAPSPTSNENQLIKNGQNGQNINGNDYTDSDQTNQNTLNVFQNLLGNNYSDIQSPIENG